ncbi:MAG: hypothetical protein ACRDPO_17265 [Streptosporangiaceae bacterium]
MTGSAPGPAPEPDDPDSQARADWIRGVDTALAAAGLATRLNQTAGGLDVTATIHPPGRKPAEIVVDEDGYLEIQLVERPGRGPAAGRRRHHRSSHGPGTHCCRQFRVMTGTPRDTNAPTALGHPGALDAVPVSHRQPAQPP